jgi:hypothetical protein
LRSYRRIFTLSIKSGQIGRRETNRQEIEPFSAAGNELETFYPENAHGRTREELPTPSVT